MQAKIDITTPTGKSLEGFPFVHDATQTDIGLENKHTTFYTYLGNTFRKWTLHKGDKITIEIL